MPTIIPEKNTPATIQEQPSAQPHFPQQAPYRSSHRIRRRRKSTRLRVRRLIIRILIVLAMVAILLLSMQGVAFSQTPVDASDGFSFQQNKEKAKEVANAVAQKKISPGNVAARLTQNKAGAFQEKEEKPSTLRGLVRALEKKEAQKPNMAAQKPTAKAKKIVQKAKATKPIAKASMIPTAKGKESELSESERSSNDYLSAVAFAAQPFAEGKETIEQSAARAAMNSGKRLSQVKKDELSFLSTLDLALALEREFRGLEAVGVDTIVQTLRYDLIHKVMDLSVAVGYSDNPRNNLEAIRKYMNGSLQISAVNRKKADLKLLMLSHVMKERRASQLSWCMLALILSEKLNPYLDLETVSAGGVIGLRYRSGPHLYILLPYHPDKIHTNESFLQRVYGDNSRQEHKIKTLTRQQFWAMVFAEAGSALLEQPDMIAQATDWTEKGLQLYSDQAVAHISQAKILKKKNELKAAREELDIAMKIRPMDLEARLLRVDLLLSLGEDDQALEDLKWLSRTANHLDSVFRLIHMRLDRSEHLAAQREMKRLLSMNIPEAMKEKRATLHLEVQARKWIEVLNSKSPDSDRFLAIDELRRFNTNSSLRALIASLSDSNLRLARYSWATLKKMTQQDLPPVPERWLEALELGSMPDQ